MWRKRLLTPLYESKTLNWCNRVATLLHFLGFIGVLAFAAQSHNDVVYQLTHTVARLRLYDHTAPPPLRNSTFDKDLAVYLTVENTGIYLRLSFLIAAFFFFSFLFQFLFKSTCMRYIEYTFTGSLVAVIILLQTQQTDASVVWAVYILHAVCMLCGAIADKIHHFELQEIRDSYLRVMVSPPFLFGPCTAANTATPQCYYQIADPHIQLRKIKWMVHALGWIPFIIAWTIIFAALSTAAKVNPKMPTWVPAIVATEFVLFGVFGLTQIAHLAKLATENTIHLAFIVQSLFSKMLLAIIISSELFAPR